jgi:hypothetical protein
MSALHPASLVVSLLSLGRSRILPVFWLETAAEAEGMITLRNIFPPQFLTPRTKFGLFDSINHFT